MEPILDRAEWESLAQQLPDEQAKHYIALRLWETYQLAKTAAVAVDWGYCLAALHIPFDLSPWNRMVQLMYRELKNEQAKHFGLPFEPDDVLDREWTLSGWNRRKCLETGRLMGYGRPGEEETDPEEDWSGVHGSA